MMCSTRTARKLSTTAALAAMGLLLYLGTSASAQGPETNGDTAVTIAGPPNQGLALSAKAVWPPRGEAAGVLALDVRLTNLSDAPIPVYAGVQSPLWFRVLIYNAQGECVLPVSMDRGFPIPGPRTGLPAGPRTPTSLAARGSVAVDRCRGALRALPRDTPPGSYSLLVLAVDPAKGISSLLVSNLVTFDWPRPAE